PISSQSRTNSSEHYRAQRVYQMKRLGFCVCNQINEEGCRNCRRVENESRHLPAWFHVFEESVSLPHIGRLFALRIEHGCWIHNCSGGARWCGTRRLYFFCNLLDHAARGNERTANCE